MATNKQQQASKTQIVTKEPTAATAKRKGPTQQEKRLKFGIIAERRTKNALKAIRRLRALSRKANYDYDQDQVERILAALNKAVEDVQRSFADQLVKEFDFKL